MNKEQLLSFIQRQSKLQKSLENLYVDDHHGFNPTRLKQELCARNLAVDQSALLATIMLQLNGNERAASVNVNLTVFRDNYLEQQRCAQVFLEYAGPIAKKKLLKLTDLPDKLMMELSSEDDLDDICKDIWGNSDPFHSGAFPGTSGTVTYLASEQVLASSKSDKEKDGVLSGQSAEFMAAMDSLDTEAIDLLLSNFINVKAPAGQSSQVAGAVGQELPIDFNMKDRKPSPKAQAKDASLLPTQSKPDSLHNEHDEIVTGEQVASRHTFFATHAPTLHRRAKRKNTHEQSSEDEEYLPSRKEERVNSKRSKHLESASPNMSKAEIRRAGNRLSAQRSRERRVKEFNDLFSENQRLAEENSKFKNLVKKLKLKLKSVTEADESCDMSHGKSHP